MSPDLPAAKSAAIIAEFGDAGRRWVDAFPALLARLCERWQLSITGVADAGLPINLICFATRPGGQEVALKVGHPHPEQLTEMVALEHFESRFCVPVIASAPTDGALLLQRVKPGRVLRDVAVDRSCIAIAALGDISLPLRGRPVPDLPAYGDWLVRAAGIFFSHTLEQLEGPEADDYARHLQRACELFAHLEAKVAERYLLHGDLHHENLLENQVGEWLAIDPKGVIGPVFMESGRYLHNFIHDEIGTAESLADCSTDAIKGVLETRLQTLSDLLSLTPARLASAGYIDLALALCWTINSKHDIDHDFVRLLGCLADLSESPRGLD